MQIRSVSIRHFRSISFAESIELTDKTILLGPNNEGKSNFIAALDKFFDCLSNPLSFGRNVDELYIIGEYPSLFHARKYDWKRDFPVNKTKSTEKNSEISIEFSLSNLDEDFIFKKTGSRIRNYIRISLSLGQDNKPNFRVIKKGNKQLTKKFGRILFCVKSLSHFSLIPAIRTAASAQRVITRMIERQLENLKLNEEYSECMRKISEIETKAFADIADGISVSLRKFVPTVKNVEISLRDEERRFIATQACRIDIDDGKRTRLEMKGDGMQSLAALSLMRYASDQQATGKSLILAIEEPEAHLHPAAMHKLAQVIEDISRQQQVIVTTHNPLFVDTLDVRNNIIVRSSKAKKVSTIEEVRKCLGVKVSGNLRNASFILFVEGESDAIALQKLLPAMSPKINSAFSNRRMIISSTRGNSRLALSVQAALRDLCAVHVPADNDQAGRECVNSLLVEDIIEKGHYNLCTVKGMRDSEFEDLIVPAVYTSEICKKFATEHDTLLKKLKKTAPKWSIRMRDFFNESGKLWSESTEKECKFIVARSVADFGAASVCPHRGSALIALVSSLERRLAHNDD